ncbi:multidrug effflux MFS transporter [Alkalibacillus haloalkaliphilus]|uniref:multidrug effflux MFS transporter n=1 Tax=Alkalibacillus haloalkaliphilus TaxID=94136 RepID=UPI0029369F4E|nr:multidrug effflux MFS transporter [Alkalibacillus haloalkaliphilus]MDV2581493.1 multidrug effflux MFS transporter [Alkalibacillus haloalkaliphilus]
MTNSRFRLLLMLGALTALVPLTIDMYLPAFPALTEDLNTTNSLTQISLTASLLGIAFGQLIIGSMSDIYGRKRPLVLAISLFVIASFLCAIAPNIWVFIACRFIQGFTGAAGIVLSRSMIRDLYSGPDMTKMFSLLILVMGLAPILAPVIGGQVLTFTSWRGIFTILAIAGVLVTLMSVFKVEETLPKERRSAGGLKNTVNVFVALLKQKSFIGFALIQGFVAAALFSYISGSSFILQDIFNLSAQTYGIVFGVNALGFITLSQITGRLVDYVKEEKLLVAGFVIALSGGITLLLASINGENFWAVMLGLFLVISSVGVLNPTSLSLAMEKQENNAGSAAAFLGLFQFIFGGVAAPLVGFLGTTTVLPLALIILVCQLSALLSYIILVRRKGEALGS